MNIYNENKSPIDFMAAPATLADKSFTLVWDKPVQYEDIIGYAVYQDEIEIAQTKPNKTHFTIKDLTEDTIYKFRVELISDYNASTPNLIVRTKPSGVVIDITEYPYYADKTGDIINTDIVQAAIDNCPADGTVLVPKGATVLIGAIELKSDMTLKIDGVLKASLEPSDYIIKKENKDSYKGLVNEDGLILTRYEGWEMYCYRSLINAGHLNPNNRLEVTCENIRICGNGTIYGGGNQLGTAMKRLYADKEKYPDYVSDGIGGRRIRGRLLSFIQCKNVHLTGLNIENPSCWTVHMIYCDTVTTHGVNIKSRGIDNGDGWDPDSSRNLMIFDTIFDTGDDCIAIKSGKNPDGNIVNIPTKNVKIFDLKMQGGNGMAIGSEQSGGVEDINMRDLSIINTRYGLELKAHNSRGGYIKNILMMDCVIDKFSAHSVTYNADGSPAPELPYFKDITIKNTVINGTGRVIELIGFTKEEQKNMKNHYIHNVLLENITLGSEKDEINEIYLKNSHNIIFKNVKQYTGERPKYILDRDSVSDVEIIDNII